MASMNQKPSEAGWFYHAPARATQREPVGAPPASQIPGLGQIEVLEREEPREVVFKDTDTKYIRMAKMGGRKDLLSIRPNQAVKREPVPYPRNEWFYLEDNALEDKALKDKEEEEWQFLLPEYMVHQSYQPGRTELAPQDTNTVPMRPAPYATAKQSSFYEDGQSLTDKTVKIPEARQPGYGVRNAKPPTSVGTKKQPAVTRSKPLSSQIQGDKPRLKQQPLPAEKEEPVSMAKLLSGAYDKEWHDKMDKWHQKQHEHLEKSKGVAKGEGPTVSSTKAESLRKSPPASKNEMGAAAKKEEQTPKEPFKMSKFKNVQCRINSHQSPQVLAAVHN